MQTPRDPRRLRRPHADDSHRELLRAVGPRPGLITRITDAQIVIAVTEGFTAMDPKDAHPVPGVAEKWENPDDPLTWTFLLRDNAR